MNRSEERPDTGDGPDSAIIEPGDLVYAVVRRIPPGRVATYGQIADMVEQVVVTPRQVGGMMAVCPPDVPWQRVVGAGGRLRTSKRSPALAQLQRTLLEREGVAFTPAGLADVDQCLWDAQYLPHDAE